MTFGEKLRKLRKDADMTQEELAARLYVTRAAVSKWETDKGYPAIDSLKLIAELFSCTIDELVSDADVENQKKLESDRAKFMYVCAIACFAVAVAFAGVKRQFGCCHDVVFSIFCNVGQCRKCLFFRITGVSKISQ